MDRMHADRILAKPEVRAFLADAAQQLRRALPPGSFALREQAALAVTAELVRTMLTEELQEIAASFGDEVLVGSSRFKVHEEGSVVYHGLTGAMVVRRPTYREGVAPVLTSFIATSRVRRAETGRHCATARLRLDR